MRLLLVGSGADVSTKDVEDGYRDALKAMGHEIVEYRLSGRITVAGGYLRYAWDRARRGGADVPRPTSADVLYWACNGILERALRFEVDWVLIVSGMYVHPDWLIYLHRAGVPTALLLTESPYDTEREARVAPFADVVFTNERAVVGELREHNPQTFYLGHAYDLAKHRPHAQGDDDVAAHDVVFVGTGFVERCEVLAAVDWAGIGLGLYGHWPLLGSRSKLRQYIRGGAIPNTTTAALYRRAKIGLNLYRTSKGFGRRVEHVTHAESLNPRALELAATGCFTISDYRAEVEEVFGPSVPTFADARELETMIRYYLERDEERHALAEDARRRVAGHTYIDRATELVRTLERAHTQREAA